MAPYSSTDIQYFLAVAKFGHIGRAALHCEVHPSSISRAIQRLEQSIGVVLLERGVQGSRLTGAGETFHEAAQRWLAQQRNLERVAAELRAHRRGTLRLGVTNPSGEDPATRALAWLLAQRPGLRIRLTHGQSDVLQADVLTGQLDAAVVPIYTGVSLECVTHEIAIDPLEPVARHDHPVWQRHSPALTDLIDYDWILPGPDAAARRLLAQRFAEAGLPAPRVAVETEYPSQAAMGLLSRTNLLCLASRPVQRQWAHEIRPLPIESLKVARRTVLLTHPQGTWTPLLLALRDALMTQASLAEG